MAERSPAFEANIGRQRSQVQARQLSAFARDENYIQRQIGQPPCRHLEQQRLFGINASFRYDYPGQILRHRADPFGRWAIAVLIPEARAYVVYGCWKVAPAAVQRRCAWNQI